MEAATTAPATQTQAEPAEPATGSNPSSQNAAETGVETTSDERDETGKFLSREATNYRRRLRETETERDQLRERVDHYERAEVERLASAAGLAAPGDVWTFGAGAATLRDEDGHIDADAVSGLVSEIIADRPGLKAPKIGDLGIGRGAAAAGTTQREPVGLSQLLKPGRT